MRFSSFLVLSLASLTPVLLAQTSDPAGSQPAPIVRSNPNANSAYAYDGASASPYGGQDPRATSGQRTYGRMSSTQAQVVTVQPIPGVWLRTDASATVQTVSANDKGTELRLTHGRANIDVHHPAQNSQILVDLPGGQVDLLKDGVYTFNAETNTVRVLKGEAETFGATNTGKPIKIKEEHQLTFAANVTPRSVDAYPNEIAADLLPHTSDTARGEAYSRPGYGPYGDGFYGAGYGYGYPYYAYASPFGYGYPYGYGLGLGFGYYGGFRGGYGGGFRGYRGFRR